MNTSNPTLENPNDQVTNTDINNPIFQALLEQFNATFENLNDQVTNTDTDDPMSQAWVEHFSQNDQFTNIDTGQNQNADLQENNLLIPDDFELV